MTEPFAPIDEALAFRIYRLQRLLRLDLVRFLDQHEPGLPPEHFFLLMRLAQVGAVRQQELVEPAIGDRPNISRHVATLVRRGLVAREPDPSDGRASLVGLTAEGEVLVARLQPLVQQERRRIFGDLSDHQLAAFRAVLDHLESVLER